MTAKQRDNHKARRLFHSLDQHFTKDKESHIRFYATIVKRKQHRYCNCIDAVYTAQMGFGSVEIVHNISRVRTEGLRIQKVRVTV